MTQRRGLIQALFCLAAVAMLGGCTQKGGLRYAGLTESASTAQGKLAIVQPDPRAETRGSLELRGSCRVGFSVFAFGGGLDQAVSAPCDSGSFSISLNLSGPDGVKSIVVQQVTSEGIALSDERSFIIDTLTPVLVVNVPTTPFTSATQFTFTGSCESSLNVFLAGAGLPKTMTSPCAGEKFSLPVTLDIDGVRSFELSQTDRAGNTAKTPVTIVKDSIAPALTIT
ncbi:MAG: hypothetical protein ABL958_15325, partial [Bdellovibrionia bacterium]